MNKTEIIQKIKQLEGLTNDERAYLVELVNTKKKYGLVWEDKPETVEEQLRTHLPVLREVTERRITAPPQPSPQGREKEASPDPSAGGEKKKAVQNLQQLLFEPEPSEQLRPEASPRGGGLEGAPNHILIEGDNLHALTALTFTHEGQIDVMYFDPPYNTGNKDFKYNDSFVDREDSYRHSKWLSFMDKRLRIAKRLLSEKGVVFISIDDNEMSQLKMLCDNVLNENNFVVNLIWKSKSGGASDSRFFASDHEYILIYAKDILKLNLNLDSDATVTTLYNFSDDNGAYALDRLDKQSIRYSDSGNFEIIGPDGTRYWPKHKNPEKPNATWRWGKNTVKEKYEELVFKDGNVYTKNYKSDASIPRSLLIEERFGRTRTGKTDLFSIFNENNFTAPKPIKLLIYFLKLFPDKKATILDFFAGSGTTLHATMQLNAEDGGNRQCILVTNNENNIAEEVCYERNRRVIQGYTNNKGEWVPGLTNNNLRYYKSEFVGREPSLKNKRELTKLATELLCIKEDCYTDVTRDLGNFSWHKLFTNGRGSFVYVVFDDLYIEDAVDALKKFMATQNPEIKIKVYVFANGQYAYAEEFEEIAANITLAALPDAIYKAYQNVLPKENREFIPVLEDETFVEPQTNLNL
jgi:adenine-specific DNA-methyltransferase